jgi:hypothetical protein
MFAKASAGALKPTPSDGTPLCPESAVATRVAAGIEA